MVDLLPSFRIVKRSMSVWFCGISWAGAAVMRATKSRMRPKVIANAAVSFILSYFL